MPDTATAREALRRLVAGLIVARDLNGLTSNGEEPVSSSLTTDEILARLHTVEAAEFDAVLAALDEVHEVTAPRFVYAEKDRDYKTGAARGYVVLDLAAVCDLNHEAELFAACPSQVNARTLVGTLNEHPPAMAPPFGYDLEPF